MNSEVRVSTTMKISLLVMLVLVVGACNGASSLSATAPASLTNVADGNIQEPEQKETMEPTEAKTANNSPESTSGYKEVADAVLSPLPQQSRPQPATTGAVPHQQIGVEDVPSLNESLHRWISSLPDVEMQNSIASLPGATGVWIKEGTAIDQPQVILAGREFTHIHPDGSLHTPLPFARAMEAVEMGWAERHPWAGQRAGWEGLVMLYTPQSEAELEIVFQLVLESYNFVTGQSEVTTDYIQSQ